MKIDCSKTVNFFEEQTRMCKSHKSNCYDCLIYKATLDHATSCQNFIKLYTEEAIEIVQKWSDEHPQKTRMNDLLEKYPNADKEKILEYLCVGALGYDKPCECPGGDAECEDCWNMPI